MPQPAPASSIAATIETNRLPTGKQPALAEKRLARLIALYNELHHIDNCIKYIGRYLPKLKLNEELAASKKRLQQEISDIVNEPTACSVNSSSSSK